MPKELHNVAGHRIVFSPDEKRMIIAGLSDFAIYVLDISNPTEVSIEKVFYYHKNQNYGKAEEEGEEDEEEEESKGRSPVASLVISSDGKWLARGDLHNRIDIYNMNTLQVRE